MTFQRVLNRNRIKAADYGTKASGWNTGPGRTMLDVTAEDFNEGVDFVEVLKNHIKECYTAIDAVNAKWSMLCGDLQRLEIDTLDERAICQYIVNQTGVSANDVAAVLKTWIEW